MCFIWFSQTTINRLVFAVESKCVLCEVGTGFPGIVAVDVRLQSTQGVRTGWLLCRVPAEAAARCTAFPHTAAWHLALQTASRRFIGQTCVTSCFLIAVCRSERTLFLNNNQTVETRRFVTVLTKVRCQLLSWARWIQSTSSRLISLKPTVILSYHLCVGLRRILSRFSNQSFVLISNLSRACYTSCPSYPSWVLSQ